MAEKTTVSSLMKEWNDHLTEDVSAFTVVPEGSCDAYGVRRKNIDTLMTTTHKLMTALDKSQKKDSENWAHVGTAGEIANKLSDINQMLGGI